MPRGLEEWTRIVLASVISVLLTAMVGWISLGRDLVTRDEMNSTLESRFSYRFDRLETQMERVQQGLARIEGRLEKPAAK